MKVHFASEGETLFSIYNRYYGEPKMDDPIDQGFSYFYTCNLHVATLSPFGCVGGELVILPFDSEEADEMSQEEVEAL